MNKHILALAIIWMTFNIQCNPDAVVTVYQISKATNYLLVPLYSERETALPNPFRASRTGAVRFMIKATDKAEYRFVCVGGTKK